MGLLNRVISPFSINVLGYKVYFSKVVVLLFLNADNDAMFEILCFEKLLTHCLHYPDFPD